MKRRMPNYDAQMLALMELVVTAQCQALELLAQALAKRIADARAARLRDQTTGHVG